uniref:Uncharacterized protein n=1 Tax=Oncorhynchus tshawytscha TaxID=74940 RepID=A0AAZ3NQ45_ONCTS
MWQKVAKFKGAEYFRKALYLRGHLELLRFSTTIVKVVLADDSVLSSHVSLYRGSPDKDGVISHSHVPLSQKKTNGAPNGYYGEIDWDRYATPDVDAEGFSPKGKQHFLSSSDSEDEDDKRKFKIKIKPLPSDTAKCAVPSMDELKASVGGLALSPSLVSP